MGSFHGPVGARLAAVWGCLIFFVGHEQQIGGLSCSTYGHLVPFVLGCPSARQRGGKKGAASCPASLCCPPLHSTAHRVAGLPATAMAMWGCLCPQVCVERATVISRPDASSCSGARAQESSTEHWGRGRGPWGASRVSRKGTFCGCLICPVWDGEQMESCRQVCVLLWFRVGVDAHLQGRGEARKKQPPVLLSPAQHCSPCC